jgi:hypothetical protein
VCTCEFSAVFIPSLFCSIYTYSVVAAGLVTIDVTLPPGMEGMEEKDHVHGNDCTTAVSTHCGRTRFDGCGWEGSAARRSEPASLARTAEGENCGCLRRWSLRYTTATFAKQSLLIEDNNRTVQGKLECLVAAQDGAYHNTPPCTDCGVGCKSLLTAPFSATARWYALPPSAHSL